MITLKKFQDCEAYGCRWSELVERMIGDWHVLWEEAEVDYQGGAKVLAYKDGAFCFVEWTYGSCSGCDPWEDMPEEDAFEEMKRDAMYFQDGAVFYSWIEMLRQTGDEKAKLFVSLLFELGNLLREEGKTNHNN